MATCLLFTVASEFEWNSFHRANDFDNKPRLDSRYRALLPLFCLYIYENNGIFPDEAMRYTFRFFHTYHVRQSLKKIKKLKKRIQADKIQNLMFPSVVN